MYIPFKNVEKFIAKFKIRLFRNKYNICLPGFALPSYENYEVDYDNMPALLHSLRHFLSPEWTSNTRIDPWSNYMERDELRFVCYD